MLAFHPENGGVAAFHTLFLLQAPSEDLGGIHPVTASHFSHRHNLETPEHGLRPHANEQSGFKQIQDGL
jgi:hypothetical protein